MSIPILVAILIGASTEAAQSRSLPLIEEQIQSLDPVGSCEGNGRSINLHSVAFLENRIVDIDWSTRKLRLSFERDNFYADEIVGGSVVTQHYRSVRDDIENGDDLDIELKFAYFEGALALYWRETYQNRHYRQGLFRISGPDLTFLCAGQGGRLAVR